jgi:hypothetical protein
MTVYLVQGDAGSQVKAIITREDTGLPVDLSDATPRLKFKKKNTTTVLATITSIASSPDDLEAGVAVFAFTSTHLDVAPGEYVGEIEVSFNSGSIETVYEQITIMVREDY